MSRQPVDGRHLRQGPHTHRAIGASRHKSVSAHLQLPNQ
jgi:hypothetical protein